MTTRQHSSAVPANQRWLYVGVGTIMLILLGLIYAWSVFVGPLEKEFGWSRADTSLTFSISMSFFCIGGVLGGLLARRKTPPRITILLGAACLLVGFLLASLSQALVVFYLTYGVVCSLGVGLIYNTLLGTITKWFPERQGFISGVLLMGFGFGGLLLSSVATALMTSFGWRSTFVVFGISFAVILVAGSLILRPAPAPSASAAHSGPSYTTAQMVRRPSFWTYFAWSLLLSAAGLALVGHAGQIVTQLLGADREATMATSVFMVGLVSVCNGGGRVVFGLLFDRAGWKPSMLAINIGFLCASLVLWLAFQTGSFALLAVGFVATGLCYGGVPTANSNVVNRFYGAAHYPINYSIVNTVLIPAAFLGPYMSGALVTASGSYQGTFLVTALMGAAALVAVFATRKA